MAVYRNIQLSFWTDTKIADDFTPEDKYFYLYLLTNQHTNVCGCYEISIKQIATETGYSQDTVEKLINRMQNVHKVIQYSNQYKEVLIFNFPKYNWTNSPLLMKSIEKKINSVKTLEFKRFLTYLYNHIDTLSIGYTYPIESTFSLVSDSLINNIENQKEDEKKKYSLDVETFFESVWRLYIRKEGKNQVNQKAKEEIFNIGYERMKQCIDKYARLKKDSEKRYILMGSTFFNGRYKDYLEELVTEEPHEKLEEADEEMTDEEFEQSVMNYDLE